jgi:hypothetical protein
MAKRQIVVAALLIAALAPSIGAVQADSKVITLKHVSYDDLKKKCDAAGGKFDSVGTSDYWCQVKDGNTVTCNTKQCTGTVKEAGAPQSTPRQQLANPTTATEMLSAD